MSDSQHIQTTALSDNVIKLIYDSPYDNCRYVVNLRSNLWRSYVWYVLWIAMAGLTPIIRSSYHWPPLNYGLF